MIYSILFAVVLLHESYILGGDYVCTTICSIRVESDLFPFAQQVSFLRCKKKQHAAMNKTIYDPRMSLDRQKLELFFASPRSPFDTRLAFKLTKSGRYVVKI